MDVRVMVHGVLQWCTIRAFYDIDSQEIFREQVPTPISFDDGTSDQDVLGASGKHVEAYAIQTHDDGTQMLFRRDGFVHNFN